VPESVKHNFLAIEGRTPFKDLNFGFLTIRTSIVYTVCSPHHLHNIREIFCAGIGYGKSIIFEGIAALGK